MIRVGSRSMVFIFCLSFTACGDDGGAKPGRDGAADSPGVGGASGSGGTHAVGGSAGATGVGGSAGQGGAGAGGVSGSGGGFDGAAGAGGTKMDDAAAYDVAVVFDADLDGPRAGHDANVDAPTYDASAEPVACKDPNPASTTCLASKGQCVPSTCTCTVEGRWACSADCRGNLPLCDAGAGLDVAGPDGASAIDSSPLPSSCSYNRECPTGYTCFGNLSARQCVPTTQICSNSSGGFCQCNGCMCSGTYGPEGFWACTGSGS